MEQQITIEVIESKEFRIVAKGYDQREVDEFLDSICDEFERMQAQVADMEDQVEMARAEARKAAASSGYVQPAPAPAPVNVPDNTFREILEMAQRVKEQTIAEAEAKAAQILADAQAEATARLGGLDEELEALTKKVEDMKQSAQNYKNQFADLIKLSQDVLDSVEL